jgi:C-terminal processing protease CtpA/Prc
MLARAWTALLLGLSLASAACGGATVGSIGALLGRHPETGAVHVRGVPDGNAADRAGLEIGDEIVFVDGKDVRNLDVAGLRRVLRGEPGTRVQLTILRDGQVVRIEVERAALLTPTPKAPEGEQRVEEE